MNHIANDVHNLDGVHPGLAVVLGASGGLGRALLGQLAAQGHPVRAVSRTRPVWFSRSPGVEWMQADVSQAADAVRACAGAEVVFHAAQPPYGEWPELFPAMTENIIDAAASANAKLVMVDNLYMYGTTTGPLHEQLPRQATGPKGVTRTKMEKQLTDAHRSGKLRVTIGRLSDYYGPNGPNTTVAALVLDKAIAGKAMQWPGVLHAPHTLHFLPDAAQALILLANSDGADGKIWHLPASPAIDGGAFMDLVNVNLATKVKCKTMSTTMMRIGGLFSKEAKETVECMYQWTAPFVVDATAFTSAFGPFRTTPHDEAVRQTIASMQSANHSKEGR